MMRIVYACLLLFAPLEQALAQKPPAPGLLQLRANEFAAAENIAEKEFYTGRGIAAVNRHKKAWVQYQLPRFTRPVYVHLLGCLDLPLQSDSNALLVSVGPVQKTVRLTGHATRWHRLPQALTPGKTESLLTLTFSGKRQQYIEQLILTTDPNYTPRGMAFQQPGVEAVLPPAWAFGVLYGGYTNQQKTAEVIDSIIQSGFPIDAYWIDSWIWDYNTRGKGPRGYMNFSIDSTAFPDPRGMWQHMAAQKIKSGIWVWNCLQREGNEAVFDSFQKKKLLKEPFINKDGWHNKTRLTITADIDFANDAATAYWKQQLQPHFENGLDFLKLDRSSNLHYCKAAFEASQEMGRETKGRGFIFNHLMNSDDERFKLYPTKWSGDAKIAWTMPDYPDYRIPATGALKENIAMISDPSLTTYDIPFLAHDGGGYDFFGSTEFSNELYTRWIQFTALAPITTLFSTSNNPSRNHPYWFNDTVQQTVRKYLQLRMQLFPYIYTAAHAVRKGARYISAYQKAGQYLLGNDLLVAPVCNKGALSKTVYLGKESWIDWETGTAYRGRDSAELPADLGTLPLLVREGAIIPMRSYARAIELGSNDSLLLKIFAGNGQSGSLLLKEDDGSSNDYLKGAVATTAMQWQPQRLTIEAVQGSYAGMKPERFYQVQIKSEAPPSAVYVNNKAVPFRFQNGWVQLSFSNPKNKTLQLQLQ